MIALAEDREFVAAVPAWVWDLEQDYQQKQVTWVTGGLGSGKTYGSAIWHLDRCFLNNQSKFSWHIDLTHSKAEEISIPSFTDALINYYGQEEGRDFQVIQSKPQRIILKRTGQVIRFHTIKKWREMVGPSISHWSATEVGYYPSRDWLSRCMSRLRCPKAVCLQGLGEGTPEGMNWWATLADFAEGYDPATNQRRVILWTSDNKHLKPDYEDTIREAYNYDKQRLDSYLYGLFVPFTHGTAYWEFLQSRNVKLDLIADPHIPLILTWDFNLTPLTWVAMQRQAIEKRFGDRYHRFLCFREASGESRGLLDASAEFIAAFPPAVWGDTEIQIHGDPTGYAGSHKTPSCDYDIICQYLGGYYRNVRVCASHKAPRVRAQLERVNAALAYDQLVIAPICRNLIKSLTLTALKPGTWDIEKPGGEWWTHPADAVGYPIFELTKDEDFERPGAVKPRGLNQRI